MVGKWFKNIMESDPDIDDGDDVNFNSYSAYNSDFDERLRRKVELDFQEYQNDPEQDNLVKPY